MKHRLILMSAPMVRAILEGRKTQTRRVVKPHPGWIEPEEMCNVTKPEGWQTPGHSGRWWCRASTNHERKCPYGLPGDRLWVKETALPDAPIDGWDGDVEWDGCGRPWAGVPEKYRKPEHVIYAASWTGHKLVWKPSIHMPRWASRITLEVVSVRVERVRDISEADAVAEGFTGGERFNGKGEGRLYSPAESFLDTFFNINKRAPKDTSPWVWVVEFKRAEQAIEAAKGNEGKGK